MSENRRKGYRGGSVTCEISEHLNDLKVFDDNSCYPVVVIPNAFIDEFISALQKHMSSEGDGQTFTIDFETGELML